MAAPVDSAPLFEPLEFKFSGRKAPNRFLKAAMSEKLATWDPTDLSVRGFPTPELITLYKNWGAGGWGVSLTSNIIIDSINVEAAGNLMIPAGEPFEGERFDKFKALATAAKADGNLLVGQVSHGGRQVVQWINPEPISASNVQLTNSSLGQKHGAPREATKEEIAQVVEGFANAAAYLEKAGFDGIELHGAHGYLLAQFLSPQTNQRTDEYGGSRENRFRIVLEIRDAIKKRVKPDFIVGIKINSVEYSSGGIELEDAVQLCIALENAQFDFVELSGGNYEKLAFTHIKEANRKREAFFLNQAEEIVKHLKREMKVYCTGGYKSVAAMANSLSIVDGVGIGRVACQEPRLPLAIKNANQPAALQQKLEDDDFPRRFAAAGVHITQIASGEEPVDLSVQENVDSFWNDMVEYYGKVATDEKHELFRFPVLSQPRKPYGEQAAKA